MPEIKTGMKFTKFIHEVFKNEKLDMAFSEYTQQTKSKGFFTISIDPIDYMLMSMNNYNWDSCHSLRKDKDCVSQGAYCAGVFSYMCDNNSLIAFKHSKNELEEIYISRKNKIKALNKSWRQMIFVNLEEKFFINSRQYPYKNEAMVEVFQEMMKDLISQKFQIPSNWKARKNSIDDYITDNKVTRVPASPLHYNDVLRASHTVHMMYHTSKTASDLKKAVVGSYPICPVCGRMQLTHSSKIYCDLCIKDKQSKAETSLSF